MEIESVNTLVKEIDKEIIINAQKHFDSLIKPVGSLGKLETMITSYAGAEKCYDPKLLDYPSRTVLAFLEEGNKIMPLDDSAPLKILTDAVGGKIVVEEIKSSCRITDALNLGEKLTVKEIKSGCKLIAPIAFGRYVVPSGWERLKKQEPKEILETLGSPICAALVGSIITAAENEVQIMLDGLATIMAAYIAIKIAPNVKEYCICSQLTTEKGQGEILEELEFSPLLKLQFKEGNGCGAALGFGLFDAGLKAYKEMETFAQAGVHDEMEEFSHAKEENKRSKK